jgi:signal peptidase
MREISLKLPDFAELSAGILERGGVFRFRAHGSSMYPFIRDGDVVVVRPTDPAELKTGDIVLYSFDSDRMVVHRIVGRRHADEGVIFLTRGDSLRQSDGWIRPSRVLGRVERLRRGRKNIWVKKGVWGFTGMVWIRIHPFGPLLITLARKVQTIMASGRFQP